MQREQVDPRRVVFLAGVLTFSTKGGASQLRDSDGFSPCFPRFLQRLIPAETRPTFLARRLDVAVFLSFSSRVLACFSLDECIVFSFEVEIFIVE